MPDPRRARDYFYGQNGEEFAWTLQSMSMDRRHQIEPHQQEYFELLWIEQGRLEHRLEGLVEILKPGDLRFIRPNDRHGLGCVSPEPVVFKNFAVRSNIIEDLGKRYESNFAGRYFWFNGPHPTGVKLSNMALGRLKRLASQALLASKRDALTADVFITYLLTQIIRLDLLVSHAAPDWLVHACEAMRDPENLAGGAEQLVNLAGRSHEHVCRTMKRCFDRTPSELVNNLRLESAASLLINTDLQVSEIGNQVGMPNTSNFHRKFLARYNISPLQFRKANLVGEADLREQIRMRKSTNSGVRAD